MRVAEWLNLVVFSFFVGLAWARKLPGERLARVQRIGASGVAATLGGALLSPRLLPPLAASVVRDWLPAALLLFVYWQAGLFFTHPDERMQRRLVSLDRQMIYPLLRACASLTVGRFLLASLEVAYLFCYALVPFGMAALYLLRRGPDADHFWTVVLLATYGCYGMVPFIQTLPPRMLNEPAEITPMNPVRRFNLWILRNASIHANTFPSAHVAASISTALALLEVSRGVGGVFLFIAIGISCGAVAGRYHYAADAILGALVALVALVAA